MAQQTATTTIPSLTRSWRLRLAREMAGISTQEMAARLESHRGTVSRWEHDDNVRIKDMYLREWAHACRVPVEWLKHGEVPPTPQPGNRRKLRGRDSNPQPSDFAASTVTYLRAA